MPINQYISPGLSYHHAFFILTGTDSGSSQFFMLKWDQALIAPGRNTLDGFYSCFGFVTSGNEKFIGQLQPGSDRIVSAKVVQGLENLVVP